LASQEVQPPEQRRQVRGLREEPAEGSRFVAEQLDRAQNGKQVAA
jgi:hypothetical protein